jgi:hypothetical protein
MTTLDVQLKAEWIAGVGYRYDVLLDGETIVRRSRDPEFDAARVLHSRGLRGRFRTIDFVTGRPRMVLDIERAARLRTIERADAGPPVVGRYRPLSDDDRTHLRTHTLHQGRVFRGETVRVPGTAPKPLAVRGLLAAGGPLMAASLTDATRRPDLWADAPINLIRRSAARWRPSPASASRRSTSPA